MQQKKPHQQRSADTDCVHGFGCLSHGENLFFGDATVSMRSGDDTQGSVVFTTHVEVKPDGDHVLQHLRRRLHVHHVRFHRPWAVAFRFNTFLHGDGHVLVPRHFLVRVWNFVEQDAPHRKEPFSKNGFNQRSDCLGVGQFPHIRSHIQKIAHSEHATTLSHGAGVTDLLQRS